MLVIFQKDETVIGGIIDDSKYDDFYETMIRLGLRAFTSEEKAKFSQITEVVKTTFGIEK